MEKKLVWVDIETTGLDHQDDLILEVATVVTDENLKELGHYSTVICPPAHVDLVLAHEWMEKWTFEQHSKTGLIESCQYGESRYEAMDSVLDFFRDMGIEKGKHPMCGSSVGFDRRFLDEHMYRLASHFHYRNIDVSTVKELVKLWKPELEFKKPDELPHRALPDLRLSIAELQHYRNCGFLDGFTPYMA